MPGWSLAGGTNTTILVTLLAGLSEPGGRGGEVLEEGFWATQNVDYPTPLAREAGPALAAVSVLQSGDLQGSETKKGSRVRASRWPFLCPHSPLPSAQTTPARVRPRKQPQQPKQHWAEERRRDRALV
ncbi:hypothetical protein LX32DRAFT_162481 [Colletotrichum zoysiae]|uniref:Uncharacterized protein n=1 Tax=Colletotrichum zoysiae TaxID=1216348 RepID=A0AAD9LV14_9PEZI|nr:hypothetical protein LX32DRAFT_162481 [Colletotrichum zoysiae]